MGVNAEVSLADDAGGVNRRKDIGVGRGAVLGCPAFSYLPGACAGPASTRFHLATISLLYSSAAPRR